MTMKERRLQLQKILSSIEGVKKVYFNPPSKGMVYPCIVYEIANSSDVYADDIPYLNHIRWTLTVMDTNPVTDIPWLIKDVIEYQMFDRHFTTDGLHHYIFTIFY